MKVIYDFFSNATETTASCIALADDAGDDCTEASCTGKASLFRVFFVCLFHGNFGDLPTFQTCMCCHSDFLF